MGAPLNHLLAGVATDGHAAECAGAFSAAGGGAHPRLHGKLPVFVSRNDMGNYAHHLGDLLSVFQVFDHLKLQPQHAQFLRNLPRKTDPHASLSHGALWSRVISLERG